MNIKNKKILVTGADGFIGSHLVEELLLAGCDVRAFVYYNSFNSYGWLDSLDSGLLNKLDIFSGDIRDPNGVRNAVKGCDIVMHLAALIAIPFSYHSPDSYIDTNIKGTVNILNACRDFNIEKVLVTSTSEVYGTARYVPIDEEHPLQGQSPYSATKIGADQIALSYYRSFNTPVVVVRPFNTYGPRQSARAIIPTIITQILGGQKKIKLGSLHPTRDFTYVLDTAKAFISSAMSDNVIGEVINFGSNYEITIGDLVNKIRDYMSSSIEIITDDIRMRPEKSEVERLWASNDKAFRLTGWKPEHSLDLGLKNTIEWFSQNENLKRYKTGIYNI